MPVFPAARPNLPSAVASEDKEKRRPVDGWREARTAHASKDDFLWLLGSAFTPPILKNRTQKRSPHKAQKGRRCKNRQPSHSALKLT
jgi:hypothetical protein